MDKVLLKTIEQKTSNIRMGCGNTVVMVVSNRNIPLMPTSPKRARVLLRDKKADVYKMNPFTIRILDREAGELQQIELKFDPGSKTTGIALTILGLKRGWFCLAAWELDHRGEQVKQDLLSRSQLRRGRRTRKTRYRASRFLNRTRPRGWLPPSLLSRVNNVVTFSQKFNDICPISQIWVEQVKFDTQLMQDPNISGVLYQQGTLKGYEVREYLLEKWGRSCAYCQAQDVPMQIDHIVAKSKGGSDRISNLCLACKKCNQSKGNHSVEEFLKKKPEILKKVLLQAKNSLKDSAAVNSARFLIVKNLQFLNIKISTGSGGQTKFNRVAQGYIKSHWLDAVCIGENGRKVDVSKIDWVTILNAKGRGSRQMCKPNKYGFPRTGAKKVKRIYGFQSGDQVKMIQKKGKYKGVHEGIIGVRSTGMCDIKTTKGLTITSTHKNFTLVQRFNGYTYMHRKI